MAQAMAKAKYPTFNTKGEQMLYQFADGWDGLVACGGCATKLDTEAPHLDMVQDEVLEIAQDCDECGKRMTPCFSDHDCQPGGPYTCCPA